MLIVRYEVRITNIVVKGPRYEAISLKLMLRFKLDIGQEDG